jgi:hypothetical protein
MNNAEVRLSTSELFAEAQNHFFNDVAAIMHLFFCNDERRGKPDHIPVSRFRKQAGFA